MPILFVRAPFQDGAASGPVPFTVVEDAANVGRITVTILATDPARLNLMPVFPGRLTFKPTIAQAAVPPIIGNLYLEISTTALLELGKLLPTLNYPLVFIYRGVQLTDRFFAGTVATGRVASVQAGTLVATAEQKKDAFRRGRMSLSIEPTKAAAGAVFPTVHPDSAGTHAVTLGLGVRVTADPFADPAGLALDTLDPSEIESAARLVPVPIGYLYKALRGLTNAKWTAAAATGHKTHRFYDSLDALDAAVGANPARRWRRLRLFTTTEAKAPSGSFGDAMADVTVRASNGAATLWQQAGVNVVGELFLRRPDGEAFTLEVLQKPPATYPLPNPPAPPAAPVARRVAKLGTNATTTSVALTWTAPAAGKLPATLDVRAELDFARDPLLDPLVPLSDGMEEYRGLTVVKPKKKTPGKLIGRSELIQPLQKRLASFGFGGAKLPRPAWTVATRHAVREFQREAKLKNRVAGGAAVPAGSIVPFAGAITGSVDVPTLTEMRVWVDGNHRSPLSFDIRKSGTLVKDVGYGDKDSFTWRIEVAPRVPFALSTRYSPGGGTVFFGAGTSAADMARGTPPADHMADPAHAAGFAYLAKWEKRAILAVVVNESKIFEAINTYDNAFLTAGMIQWTAGTRTNRGELAGVLSTLAAADLQRLFGVWGLGATDITGTPFVTTVGGHFTLDGTKLTTPDQKDELRAFRWAYRFVEAAKDDAYRALQVRHAHTRIGVVRRTRLNWGSTPITAESLLQSEMLVALALDEHVNTGNVQRILQRLLDAMRAPSQLISINADTTFGGRWYDDKRAPLLAAKLKAKAKAANKKVKEVSLTATEIGDVDFSLLPIIEELLLLRFQCEPAAATDPVLTEVIDAMGLTNAAAMITQADTPSLTVTAGKLDVMNAEQFNTVVLLYLWLRQHVSRMVGAVERWDRVMAGGYAGAFGNPSNSPGVFTP